MLLSIVLALISALSYGVSDFLGGRAASRFGVARGTTLVYLFGTVAVGVAFLIGGGTWDSATVLSGSVAGVCTIIGMVSFYAAMAAGPMSLVSPLIAVVSDVVPVTVAIARGAQLSAVAWVAVGLAVVSALLISAQRSQHHVRIKARTVVIALVSGLTLGTAVVSLDLAPVSGGLTPAFLDMFVGLVLISAVFGLGFVSRPVRLALAGLDADGETSHSQHLSRRNAAWMVVVGGVLLGATNAVLLIALHIGDLAVVSVIMGIYPLGTIVLARLVLKERMSAVQTSGAGLALVATAILALAT